MSQSTLRGYVPPSNALLRRSIAGQVEAVRHRLEALRRWADREGDSPTADAATELARAAAQLQEAAAALRQQEEIDRLAQTAELQEVIAELNGFTYSVAHNLRAPLRAMQGFAMALTQDHGEQLGATGRDYAERIASAALRMDELIQDLLAYSRLSRAEMSLQPVALDDVIAEVLSRVSPTLAARITVTPPLPRVVAHRATLVLVIEHLLNNATKFVRPDTELRVDMRAESRGGQARLWVEDTGIGIAPEHQERIFSVFEQLHSVNAYPGTGIGLAIVRKGIRRMGGEVGLESEVGKGTRFWLELPAASDESRLDPV